MKTINKYVSLALLCSLFSKLMIKGLQVHESIVLLGIIALYGILETKAKNKQIEDLKKDIEKINSRIDTQSKEIEAAKTYVSSIKLGNQLRPKVG